MVATKRNYTTAMQMEPPPPTPDAKRFRSFAIILNGRLLQALEEAGYQYATPVQEKVLTELRPLSNDCLVQAKTGTGKTIAFLQVALQSLLTSPPLRKGQVSILVLSPTRELASQIAAECDRVTAKLPQKIECHTAFGGTARASALNRFLNGSPSVLVATPGRLKDILSDARVQAKIVDMRTFILDEADTMLEQGFLQDVQKLLTLLPPKSNGWQGMCFSATMPPKIMPVLHHILKKEYTRISTVTAEEAPTVDRVPQHHIVISSINETFTTLQTLLTTEYNASPSDFKCLVFATTANGAALLYSLFADSLPKSLRTWQIHSRMSQNARTRTTDEFKAAKTGILFASDVVGRGMDFPDISLVVQVGIPSSSEQYIHRVGRTARAGKDGRGVILLTQAESFFLRTNSSLPITPYGTALNPSPDSSTIIAQSLRGVDEEAKRKAYQAWLGYQKGFQKKLGLDSAGLVRMANEYAFTMGCAEPPMLDKQVVGKMGLKNVPGLRVGNLKLK